MVTALVLQLIQCVVTLPTNLDDPTKDVYDEDEVDDDENNKKVRLHSSTMNIICDTILSIKIMFLSTLRPEI